MLQSGMDESPTNVSDMAKYGKEFVTTTLELRPSCGVGRMLVEKLSPVAPDGQAKFKVLNTIAEEHNIKWDSKSFEEKKTKPVNDLVDLTKELLEMFTATKMAKVFFTNSGSETNDTQYALLAPFVVHSIYSFLTKDENERDLTNFLIFPFILSRMLHNQIWISLSRYKTAKGDNRIVDKPIEFEQVDRERNWDDQILLLGLLLYWANLTVKGVSNLPMWRTDGIIITIFMHAGPVEIIYYWLHTALHHHYLYSRYHSHHHSSVVTEPITAVIHPFAEIIMYYMIFSIPWVTTMLTGTASIISLFGYVAYFDFMNNLGHCNFEIVPKKLFTIFPPLKYMMYTPSFHSLHHTKYQTNLALYFPFYDYMYGTLDISTNTLYETSLEREGESPNVVHLTHLTTAESIYHLRLRFASLASKPQSTSPWYMRLLWHVTSWSMMVVTWFYRRTFVVERNIYKTLNFTNMGYSEIHHTLRFTKAKRALIEEAIVQAERKGAEVLTLGLLNQGEEINRKAELFMRRNLQLKLKLVDGSSLTAAVVRNSIPEGTTHVAIKGNLSKVSSSVAIALCRRGIQVSTSCENVYTRLKQKYDYEIQDNLILSDSCSQKIWLVGDDLGKTEQMNASKGTLC
ncbi:Eceriferum 1 [Heracleum sosnowskyi]|uniref:Eceriferum 1 n=1 Tax=Heracleum sosnowskyi TaxID=360622 RepID=A0AAD8NAF1_9APIA|nr:Eceriferum 1 [Heracleum sosnowskyi]